MFPEEGPFICTECQENFESSDTLKDHWDKVCNLKTKSTVEKLCNLCGKTFQRNSHLKKHVRSIHEKIPYDCTGKSLSEALILGSTNPQYDKILFIDLPVKCKKTTSSEHVVHTNCSEHQNKNKIQFVYTTCSELVVFVY